ncbi:MAG: hypothetical protein KU38_00310 [Sulfurovum sp. FS08-3]|nr:MAG: hypothetical protein KU38_00310 [Sulfurovum sp. FS08-3]
MSITMRDVATSLSAILFGVIAITGVMLFFHLFESHIKELHEVIGVVFVAAVLLHIVANWRAMRNYFAKKIFIIMGVGVVIVSSGLIAPTFAKQEPSPKKIVIDAMFHAPIEDSFAVLASQNAVAKLQAQGIKMEGNTIEEIAKANAVSPYKIVAIVLAQ